MNESTTGIDIVPLQAAQNHAPESLDRKIV